MTELIIKALSKMLIEKSGYMPVVDNSGNILVSENGAILHKMSNEGYITAEFIDGDLLTSEQIKRGLEMNRDRQGKRDNEDVIYSYKVFFFSSGPDSDKLNILMSEEYNKGVNNEYICYMSVNVESKELTKHYNFPRTAYDIDKHIRFLLENEFGHEDANVDFKELMEKKQKENSILIKTNKVRLTYALIFVNVAVWLLIKLYANIKGLDEGGLLTVFGAKENTLIMSGEYWRFLTPVFLHNGPMHLLLNSYSLFIIGTTVEKLLGRARFSFIYFIAGLMGSIASFMFSVYPGVGASGAIFGLMGALVYYGIEHPALFRRSFGKSIILMIVINIAYGFSVTGIDNFAHIGGLIGGFLSAGIVGTTSALKALRNRIAFTVITLAIIVTSLFYGFNNAQNRALAKMNMMDQLITQGRWLESESAGEEIIETGVKNKYILINTLWKLCVAELS